MKNYPTVSSAWQTYQTSIVPKNASPIQVQETRRAFYAGVISMLAILEELGDDDVSEDEGANVLDAISKECRNFTNLVGTKH